MPEKGKGRKKNQALFSRLLNPSLCLNQFPSPLASRPHDRDDQQIRTGHGRMTERCSLHASFHYPAPLSSWPLPSGLEPEVPRGAFLPVPGIPIPTAPHCSPLPAGSCLRRVSESTGPHAGPLQHPPDPCRCRYHSPPPRTGPRGRWCLGGRTPVDARFP